MKIAETMPESIAYALTLWIILATVRAVVWLWNRPLPEE